ncbi:helix-turn-helix domain-containing protein [Deminuibacter soli]|nr:XRE family transcriptional regulator [Deminuibacter soli]
MQNDIILQIGNRIKEKRKENSITLQELAESVGVTKGLISQIENNRTVPSLTVLLSIIKALQVDLNEFFDNISMKEADEPLLIKASQYETVEREYKQGSYYRRITSFKQNGKLVDVVLYRQEKDAPRGFVSTNAYEFDYMIKGAMQYTIDDKIYVLEEGDSFYYDARKPHLTTCLSSDDCTMLVFYFFDDPS